jgi:hypothetical protein
MPRKVTYQCKVCETEKKESNNWFVFTPSKIGFQLMTWHNAVERDVLNKDDTEFVCGHACCHSLLDQFLSGPVASMEAQA